MGIKTGRLRPLIPAALVEAVQITRFWNLVQKSDGCWPWLGDTDRAGYGVFTWNGQKWAAHRMSLAISTGEMPGDLLTLHSCDNPPCVNPAHLRLGTNQDNSDDAFTRNRTARGSGNGQSKLTEREVVSMRNRRAAGSTVKALAAEYQVTPALVSEICRGLRWTHVGGTIVKACGTGPRPRSERVINRKVASS